MVEEYMNQTKPVHHVIKHLMKRAQDMDAEEVVEKLGDKLPSSVASLVHASTKSSNGQPFSEASLAKARKILNGMIEEAQVSLDLKTIECKTFQNRNRGQLEQVNNDISRLGEQLANLERLIAEANSGGKSVDADIEKLEEKLGEEQMAYETQLAADEKEMQMRKDDLAVAQFILMFTICEDKKFFFLQGNVSFPQIPPVSNIGILKCADTEGRLNFKFADPHLEAQAQKVLTPGARLKLQSWLSDAHDAPAFFQSPDNAEYGSPVNEADDEDDDAEETSQDASVQKAATQAKADPQSSKKAIKLVAKAKANPDELPAKCTLGKPNCGLLHDNMSIMWGKFKDLVDEQQDIMDANADAWAKLQADLAQQMEILRNAGDGFAQMLSESIGNKQTDTQELIKKNGEHRLLEAEYKLVWGECVATISEILFTDICGVKTVRGEVAKHSKDVPPEAITDCEVTEFIELECSVPCDDLCDMKGKTPQGTDCGGMRTLERKVVTERNEFGMKCPKLTYPQICNQKKCPVNCKMSEWSGFGACTSECEGGTQSQTRNILVKPLNGGEGCESATMTQPCNTMSCRRDCTYPKWTPWTPCTQACSADGMHFGMTQKFKPIKVPVRGDGKCPARKSKERWHTKKCNTQLCVGDELCIAKMDLLIAIDGSGSLREPGYDILKKFAAMVVKKFKGSAFGKRAVKMGAIQFGNGKVIEKEGEEDIISPSIPIEQLTFDIDKVAGAIEKTVWQKGFTNMAQVFAKAEQMSMMGRKQAPTTILILTDGKPSFIYSLKQEAKKVRDAGKKIIIVETNPTLNTPDKSLVKELVSEPHKANYLHIKGLDKLKREMEKWVQQVVVQSCPKAYSPSKFEIDAEEEGFQLVRRRQWCGDAETKDEGIVGDGKPHMYLGTFETPADCAASVMSEEGKYFAFGTEANYNKGKCYMETGVDGEPTSDLEDKSCGMGWKKAPADFYKVLPMIEPGEDMKK